MEPGNVSAFHIYVVRLEKHAAIGHREAVEALHVLGVHANLHYLPVHLQPYYRRLGFAPGQFPEAEAHASEAITLPLFPSMSDEMQDEVVSAIRQLLRAPSVSK